jgi:hypothetical protein
VHADQRARHREGAVLEEARIQFATAHRARW